MASRFSDYLVRLGDNLGKPAFWNKRFKDVDARIGAVEDQKADLDAVIEEGRVVFRTRSNEVLQPLIEEVYDIADVGAFLRVNSETEHEPTLGGKTFYVNEGQRNRFAAPAYAVIYRKSSPEAAMLAEVQSYDRATGELVVDVTDASGAGYGGGWTISIGNPTDTADAITYVLASRSAVEAARDQASTARDEAQVFRNDTVDAALDIANYTAANEGYRDEIATKAGEVATNTSTVATNTADVLAAKGETLAARDTAQGAAVAASGSAGDAATSASAAQTARTGAETAQGTVTTLHGEVTDLRDETIAARDLAVGAKDAAETARTGAESAASTISQVYLGGAASDPVVDLSGDPLVAGASYWNTSTDQIKVYDGASWVVSVVPVGSEVTSIFGRTGNVGAVLGDYSADKITVSAIAGVSGTTVQAMLASLKTISDGKAASGHVHTFASLTSKPTTLSGYGITDVYSQSEVDASLALKLDTTAFSAAAVLAKIVAVDGSGSGLDADLVRGYSMGTTGQALFVANTQAAGRTALGLGSAALSSTGDFAPTVHAHIIADITGLQSALDAKALATRTISASGLASGGGDLSANRTITVAKATQPQAEAGTLDTVAMTPLRTKDAINALVPVATTLVAGKTRFATTAEADAGTATEITMDPAMVKRRIDAAVNALVGGAPGALNTIYELAAAFENDPNAIATLNAAIASKLSSSSVSSWVLGNILGQTSGAAVRTALSLGSAALSDASAFLAVGAKAADAELLDGYDSTFFLNISNMNTGYLAAARFNDTSHGSRAGGALHAVATTLINGFMSSTDKVKLDGVAAGATAIPSGDNTEATAGTGTTAKAWSATALKAAAEAHASSPIKAWVSFNGTGTVAILESSGVSSITDLGTGNYQVNLSAAMPNANYPTVLGGGTSATADVNLRSIREHHTSTRTSSSFRIAVQYVSSAVNGTYIDIELVSAAVLGV